jgi:hypothetical protein
MLSSDPCRLLHHKCEILAPCATLRGLATLTQLQATETYRNAADALGPDAHVYGDGEGHSFARRRVGVLAPGSLSIRFG